MTSTTRSPGDCVVGEKLIYYVTFTNGGPLRGQYAKVDTPDELTLRKYFAEHFPKDWAFLYTEEAFKLTGRPEKFNLRLCFEEKL